jgi:formiminoglutamase
LVKFFSMIADFIEPVDLNEISDSGKEWKTTQFGSKVFFNTGKKFDADEFKLAIVGVPEDRSSVDNHGCSTGPNHIRRELYQLYFHVELPAVIDLGNVKSGNTVKDTQYALKEVVSELMAKGIAVVIIGGGHDMTFGQYMAYQNKLHHTDVVLIDEKTDMEKSEEIHSDSFLWHILTHEPNFLSSITHLGHQLFYTNPQQLDMLETLDFDAIRLGEMKKDIFEIEPYVRNADLLSIDISALRSSDAPANAVTSPNGLTGEEACQLCRFAGLSNKVSTFGLYELNTYFDQNKQGVKQASQMIWYFIEGFANRRENDFPAENNQDFVKYVVTLESTDYEIVFWRSSYSNKWWMEIPHSEGAPARYLPCTYSDYQMAMQNELPDRWMKVYNRLN